MFGLLIDIRPHADESLLGYVHRLAEVNGLVGRFSQKDVRSSACPEYLAMVKGNGAHPSWLPVYTELLGCAAQSTRLWNFRHPRYCPVCLEESLYWRASWDISLMTACSRHRLRLLDSCQNCGKSLSWDRHNAAYCSSCTHPLTLRASGEKMVAIEELWFVQELEHRLVYEPRLLDQSMRHMTLDCFHEIAFRLGVCVIRRQRLMPRKIRLARSMDAAQSIAYVAGRIFYAWPNGLFEVLDELRKSCDVSASTRPATMFGLLYQELSDCHGPDLYFMQEAFDSYLKVHWRHLARRLGNRT